MIPKTVHYCSYGPGQTSAMLKRCRESWNRILPDYTFCEWNESNSPLEIDYCRAALDRGLWSKLSNYVRLWALHREGGLYLDTDVEVLRTFEPFRKHTCFLGFQSAVEIPGWVNNAVMGADAGHPFLAHCMQLTLEAYRHIGNFELSPRITTLALKKMGLRTYGAQSLSGLNLYPVEVFYPYSWRETFTPACLTSDTTCIHHWNHSWANDPR